MTAQPTPGTTHAPQPPFSVLQLQERRQQTSRCRQLLFNWMDCFELGQSPGMDEGESWTKDLKRQVSKIPGHMSPLETSSAIYERLVAALTPLEEELPSHQALLEEEGQDGEIRRETKLLLQELSPILMYVQTYGRYINDVCVRRISYLSLREALEDLKGDIFQLKVTRKLKLLACAAQATGKDEEVEKFEEEYVRVVGLALNAQHRMNELIGQMAHLATTIDYVEYSQFPYNDLDLDNIYEEVGQLDLPSLLAKTACDIAKEDIMEDTAEIEDFLGDHLQSLFELRKLALNGTNFRSSNSVQEKVRDDPRSLKEIEDYADEVSATLQEQIVEMNKVIDTIDQMKSEVEEDLSQTEDRHFRDAFGALEDLLEHINTYRWDKEAEKLIEHAPLSTWYRGSLKKDKDNFLRFLSSMNRVRRWGKDQEKYFQNNRKYVTKDGDPDKESYMKASLGTLEPTKLDNASDALRFFNWLTEWDNYTLNIRTSSTKTALLKKNVTDKQASALLVGETNYEILRDRLVQKYRNLAVIGPSLVLQIHTLRRATDLQNESFCISRFQQICRQIRLLPRSGEFLTLGLIEVFLGKLAPQSVVRWAEYSHEKKFAEMEIEIEMV